MDILILSIYTGWSGEGMRLDKPVPFDSSHYYFYNYRDSNYINLPNFPDTLFVPEATRQWKRQNL